jgi:hypothetical protein
MAEPSRVAARMYRQESEPGLKPIGVKNEQMLLLRD